MQTLELLMAEDIAGDPCGDSRWTRKTTRTLSEEMENRGIPVSAGCISRMLKDADYSLKANRKSIASTKHPQRNEQFEYIKQKKESFAKRGQPIISVDTKKKELIGNFKNAGKVWCRESDQVSDHDFRSEALGMANPYGVYDLAHNEGAIIVGTSHDTADFATSSIRKWVETVGLQHYPNMEEILILCDTGGSNGYRTRAWKVALQESICNRFSVSVTVCHYPPGASKWNPIEHRLFSFVSMNWAGIPLRNYQIMLDAIGSTTTDTGLRVHAFLDHNEYPTGRKISKQTMASLNIQIHEVLPQWNYTIRPSG